MKKLALVALTLIAVAVAVAACGDGSGSVAIVDPTSVPSESKVAQSLEAEVIQEPTSQASIEVEAERAAEVASDAIIEAPSGGVFRRVWSDPPTLDPALVTDTTSSGIVVEIFSGLVALSTDLQLVPDLAESWEISADGTVYTFTIRADATFHDGKPVTAQDFKWSLERAANPRTASPVADTYLNDLVGIDDVIEGRTTEIAGIQVIDERTLQITIDAPKAYFLAKLTYPTAYVLDRENVEAGGSTWTDNPNGTGPFTLKEYRIGERIVLERFEGYTRGGNGVDTIVMNLAGGQQMAMYENDEIDLTGVGLFDLERVLDPNEPLNSELVVAPPDFNISYIGFNAQMAPFDDVNFRMALNHAIDKELIANEVLSQLVTPAYGILPPGFPGYNPELEGLTYDPDLAQQLLQDSQYADPATRPRIVVTVPGRGGTIGLDLEVILEMWHQVLGVEVEIQQVEWATYLEDLNKQKFQAFAGLGWEADYPDPQDFLDILFHSESSLNHGGFSNAEVDALLELARIEPDAVRRVALYRDAERLIVEDAAWVPLWFQGERHVLIKPHVKGYRLTPMIVPKLTQVRIEK
jgi:oligopeptide transport system substrate-binding protein